MDAVAAVRLASLGIGLAGVLAAGVGIRCARGERLLGPFPLLIGCAGLAVGAALGVLLPPISFHPSVLAVLIGGGAIAGLVGGLVVRVQGDPRGTIVRGGAWHLLPASIAFLVLQVAGLAGSLDGVVVATAATTACTAFAAVAAVVVVIRGVATRAPSVAAPAIAAAASGAEPRLAAPAPIPPPAAGPAAVRIACGACGAPVRPGWRHCVTCGSALAWA